MKQTISAAGTPVPASVKAGTIFSWTAVSRVYNSLPFDICPCETDDDAKQYTKVLCMVVVGFIIGFCE